MSLYVEPSLWDEYFDVPRKPERLTTQQSWDLFTRRNPWFLRRVAERAYELRSLGNTRLSMKRIFEELRGEVEDKGTTFRLNNSWTSICARRIVELYGDLDGMFELRMRRSG